jgi:hypothetical protein
MVPPLYPAPKFRFTEFEPLALAKVTPDGNVQFQLLASLVPKA